MLERNGVQAVVKIGTCLQSGDVVSASSGESLIVEKVVLNFDKLETFNCEDHKIHDIFWVNELWSVWMGVGSKRGGFMG